MGNKYAKLFVALAGIMVLSFFQFQELKVYYTENLPYLTVNEYLKSHTSNEQKVPIPIDELRNKSNTSHGELKSETNENGIRYSSEELENLAVVENEDASQVSSNIDTETTVKTDDSAEVETEVEAEISQEAEIEASTEGTVEVSEKQMLTKTDIKLSAVASVLMDADSHRVLYGKNEEKELAMASTTKIMTCIVALENGNLDDIVTVSKYAAKMPDVQLNMIAGEQYYLRDLLYSLMLESHNDSAVAIAEHIGGSVEGFAEMMNEKAKELGCEHTQFVTPNGLDAEGHYTTAKELGIIASYAIKNEKFIEITNTPSHEFTELTKQKKLVVTNKNRFLYMMEGAIGVKTGFTNNAGYCFVGAIKRDDRTFISVVLGSGWPPHKTYKWNDTTTLMNYGLNNYTKQIIMDHRVELPEVYVQDGQESSVKVYADGNLSLLLRQDEKVEAEYTVPTILSAPVIKNQEIGNLNFYINGEFYTSVPVFTQEEVNQVDYKFCLEKVLNGFFSFRKSL